VVLDGVFGEVKPSGEGVGVVTFGEADDDFGFPVAEPMAAAVQGPALALLDGTDRYRDIRLL
jgi:hypothetical protein